MSRLNVLLAGLCLAPFAQASILTYAGALSAANENPTNLSTATGFATVIVDTIANTISLNVVFSGLTSNDTAAHIHCCVAQGGNAGVATVMPSFTGFPLSVTSGTFNGLFSLSDATFYNPTFVTNNGGTVASAEAVLLAGMAADQTYFNIHTGNNPGGEIRAFLQPIPEPSTFVLAALALAGAGIVRRRIAAR